MFFVQCDGLNGQCNNMTGFSIHSDGTGLLDNSWANPRHISDEAARTAQALIDSGKYRIGEWSPDGKKLLLTADGTANGQIFVINADGNELTQLTHFTAHTDSSSLSPGHQTGQKLHSTAT
jgi:hypothetical protein